MNVFGKFALDVLGFAIKVTFGAFVIGGVTAAVLEKASETQVDALNNMMGKLV